MAFHWASRQQVLGLQGGMWIARALDSIAEALDTQSHGNVFISTVPSNTSDDGGDVGVRNLVFGADIYEGGTVLTTGIKAYVRIPLACTITKWTILSVDSTPTSGSVTIDIWKDSFANYPPTVADTITASNKPAISSATKAEGTVVGWEVNVNAGDTVAFNVDSVSSFTHLWIMIQADVVEDTTDGTS